MFGVFKLLLPALIPSWNFFDVIAPSPRIQYALLNTKDEESPEWHEFRPRPAQITFIQILGRMLWNPVWNETLFMISCAERLLDQPTKHSENEIFRRIAVQLEHDKANYIDNKYLQFRVLLMTREGMQLQQELVYESRIQLLSESGIKGDDA